MQPVLKRSVKTTILVGALLSAVAATMYGFDQTTSTSPVSEKSATGKVTWYDNTGNGACGTNINAVTEDFVAVSYQLWKAANPNTDNLCNGVSVEVTYQGRVITVPVKDKCPSCSADHIDLSKSAFQKLADPSVGVINGATWKLVGAGGGDGDASTSGGGGETSGSDGGTGGSDASISGGSGTKPPVPPTSPPITPPPPSPSGDHHTDNDSASTTVARLVKTNPGRHVCYRAYVSGSGWQKPVCDGAVAGTPGSNQPIKALNIAMQGVGGSAANAFTTDVDSNDGRGKWDSWTAVVPDGTDNYIGSAKADAPNLLGFAINIGESKLCHVARTHGHTGSRPACTTQRPDFTFGGSLQNNIWLESVTFTV
ncbi:RlpA-like double-psi beta-barrel domain-containing protein [Streptomyces sp. ME03-5684b]|uniref:cysteine/serine endopeptidase inhibitor n=1 Tax=Streptomyces sp. ME03-5684b TaxID=3028681 RepID=UPI0029A70C0A|nr:cysteine/serine endopeptidase inhibitor [Streptomyces sp. ME03-5684b]MDX3323043.1 RlpA-like double-psi beta-barrel domain-containing protein [Streptomyces sp. ME03-5684b]